ncbi:peptidase C39 family protein [Bifidobacterium biavatii]|uniref:GCN5-like N-acetyltransferase n=1 Tax=Bifidobacterium biavatii DSM 23969 TaxID=1437608 RepID=A0A086ZLY6_9BIFI|nr:peptidase C39 family protein [Bifidobacterium biavatii]KFI47536.1 GCN5-like N-acetyltransferase [Bifidobacterium biavatii DSM 23969]
MTRYIAYAVEQGETLRDIDGIAIPEPTAAALAKAGGALVRTVYLAVTDAAAHDANVADDTTGEAGAASPAVASLLGYHRPHTAQQKLTAIGGERALWGELIAFAERQSLAEPDIVVVKYDITESDAAGAELASAAGGNPTASASNAAGETTSSAADVPDAATAAPLPATDATAHYRQTTEFTCGPVAVLTAMHRLGIVSKPTRAEELQMWREATIAVACEPYGLALAAERRGAHPTIRVSHTGPALHPDSKLGLLDPAMARDTQLAFERQVHEAGIPVTVAPFSADDIASVVSEGHIAVVLIDELHMHGEACPHWITVTGRDPATGALLVDDPWTDAEYGETSVDAWQLPIRPADLELMIHYDEPRSAQAMLIF